MKSNFRIFPIVAVGALAGALALPSPAQAQAGSRAGSWEFLVPVTYMPSSSFNGQGGASADLNSDLGMGLGVGYNLNNHLQLGGAITWSSRGYNATLVDTNGTPRRASGGTMDSSTLAFNATYYFMQSGFTPFVSGGIGSTFIDSNIPSGTSATSCWYDPFYGTICNTDTKTQTAFSYTAGIGLRFQLNRQFSLQGSYNKMWIDLSNGKPDIDIWKLDLVFRM